MARPDYAVNFSEQVRAWTLSTSMECQSSMPKYQPRSFFTTCSVRMLVVSNFGEKTWSRATFEIRFKMKKGLSLKTSAFYLIIPAFRDILFITTPPAKNSILFLETTPFTSWLLHFVCFVFLTGMTQKTLKQRKCPTSLEPWTWQLKNSRFYFVIQDSQIIILSCKWHILRRYRHTSFNHWIPISVNLQQVLLWLTITIFIFRFTQWWTSVDWRTCLSWLWNKILRNNKETSLVRHAYYM